MANGKRSTADGFHFPPGRKLANKYEVITRLGVGWEGEVYLVREASTDILRAAKFFFPRRNLGNHAVKNYAKKLHRLRDCSIVIQYFTQETIRHRGQPISFLVSEYVDGELLSQFLSRQPGKRLAPFQAVHLLHSLAVGIECIHRKKEYHGDLHTDNVMVRRYGLGFDLKLIDMFQWRAPTREVIQDDVVNLIKVFHEALGGRTRYARLPQDVKDICLGLKRGLILKKFPTLQKLCDHLETMNWV